MYVYWLFLSVDFPQLGENFSSLSVMIRDSRFEIDVSPFAKDLFNRNIIHVLSEGGGAKVQYKTT